MYQLLYENQAGDLIAELVIEDKEQAHETYDHALTGTCPHGTTAVVFVDGGVRTKRGAVTTPPPEPEPESEPVAEVVAPEPEPAPAPVVPKAKASKKKQA